MATQSFSKSERICSKKQIELLFGKAKGVFLFPFKVSYILAENNAKPTQILITVPKRNFKKAVDRNRLKRLIREAYRKNKIILNQLSNNNLQIAFVYIHKEIIPFAEVEKKMIAVLQKLVLENKQVSSETS